MPYRLRLFDGEHLLVTTTHETAEEAGRQMAGGRLLDELSRTRPDGSEHAELRHDLAYVEGDQERSATPAEQGKMAEGWAQRQQELAAEDMAPCARCTRPAIDHSRLDRVLGTPEGPIYFDCMTPDERTRFPDDPR